MRYFQDFVKQFRAIKQVFDRTGMDNIDVHKSLETKKIYKKLGITDSEKIRLMEFKKSAEMGKRIQIGLDGCRPFEVDDMTKRLIIYTDMPSDRKLLELIRLPFKFIWIDVEITSKEADIGVDRITGIMISESKYVDGSDYSSTGFIVHYLCTDGYSSFIDEFKISFDKDLTIHYDDKKTAKFLRNFIVNFILFYENPEIEYVERTRTKEQQEKRVRRGQMPLPTSYVVKLTGRIRRYAEKLMIRTERTPISHQFEVRGHWRHFWNEDRFKQLYAMSKEELYANGYQLYEGVIIKRIEPFRKGEGIMVDKKYKVDAGKRDKRVKDMEQENLFYDDIKPLDEPLRRKRWRE